MILPYVFVAAVVVLGVGLWIWPSLFSNEAITPSDVRELGNQVLGGAVVAAAILIAERAINARIEQEKLAREHHERLLAAEREANTARRSVRDEQRENLDRLEKWLAAVERGDFPNSFPPQSNISWQKYLPELDKHLNPDENERARAFVRDRNELKKQATKVENQSPEKQAACLEERVRNFLNEYHDIPK